MVNQTGASRREYLKLSGAAVAAVSLGPTVASAESATWESRKSPVDTTLYSVQKTARNDFAVGGAGVVVERTDTGWEKVVDGGPSGNGNDLYGAGVTDDGKRLWFVGASGAIGEYDVETGNLRDKSAPNDYTNNFRDVAVTGTAGEANVYVGDDSGNVHYSFDNGADGTWNYSTPGQGAAIRGIDFYGTKSGHLVNGNGNVFATDNGTGWTKIGPADADVSLYGIDSDASDDVWVVGGSGVVYHYRPDSEGTLKWFREKIGEPGLRDIEMEAGDGYAAGNSGAVFDRENGTWSRDDTPTTQNLKSVADGSDTDVAVGAGGTIIETNPNASADPGSGGGSQEGDAGRIARASTQTSESGSLTFTLENVGDQSVTVSKWALTTDVQVETIQRSGAEVELVGDVTGTADSQDGFPVDANLRAFDTDPVYDAGTSGEADFGLYDGGNVQLTVDPVSERPDSNYLGATLQYGDDTSETFWFKVTNVNS